MITFKKIGPIHLKCTIRLKKHFTNFNGEINFKKKWDAFHSSNNDINKIFHLKNGILEYTSEQIIPKLNNDRIPLLLIFGNPAIQSIIEGMFFSFEGKNREHRFWNILREANILQFNPFISNTLKSRNNERKKQLLDVSYLSPFKLGFTVFVTMPSNSSGPWSGILGINRLFGNHLFNKIISYETQRILKYCKSFFHRNGIIIVFQKNAWNALCSNNDPIYSLELAKRGMLVGTLKKFEHITIIGVPPTRLIGPCKKALVYHLKEYC
jgi:hypothetical protein